MTRSAPRIRVLSLSSSLPNRGGLPDEGAGGIRRRQDLKNMTLTQELLRHCLQRGQRVTFKVRGISLNPLLLPGDSFLLERVDPERLRAGELVVFEGGDGLTVHRILRKRWRARSIWFQTAGQRARIPDPWIPGTEIIGRAVEIRHGSSANRRRDVPGRWTGALWAWRTQIQCLLHRLCECLSRFISR